MMGATGNLSYLDLALDDTRHEVMTFFCLLGKYSGYGACHWNDGGTPESWDYTASGHALRWLARMRGDQLPVTIEDTNVRARAAAGEGEIQLLAWNHSPDPDTIDLALEFGEDNTTPRDNGIPTCANPFPIVCPTSSGQTNAIDDEARWMWYKRPTSNCAFLEGNQREFLIFRISASSVATETSSWSRVKTLYR